MVMVDWYEIQGNLHHVSDTALTKSVSSSALPNHVFSVNSMIKHNPMKLNDTSNRLAST